MTSDSEADLVFHSGSVLTVDRAFRVHRAAAVRGDRIVAVGNDQEVRALVGPRTRVVDLAGGTLLPGINDSHLHLAWYGHSRAALDLRDVSSLDELRDRVRTQASTLPPDAWVRGHGWHEARLGGLGTDGPRASHLDDVAGGRPVFLEHFSAHGCWLNTEALQRAGITDSTRDPEGGEIVRDAAGRATGVLKESALQLAQAAIPAPTADERRAAVQEALDDLNRRGVTSVTDPIVTPQMLRDYVAMRRDERLTARVTTLLHWTWPSVQTPLAVLREAMRYVGSSTGLGDDLLRIGGCKLIADGVAALGTAWMSRPYSDGHCGSLVTEGDDDTERVASLTAMIRLLHEHRFQVQVHATGDRACDAVVAALDQALTEDPWPDARHVLIHANLPSAVSMTTLGRHGLVANTNSLIKWQAAAGLVGILDEDSWHRMMPVRSMLEAGVVVADSSDAPITEPDWRRALQMLVTRTISDGRTVAGPDQRISREDAIRAWTSAPAYQDHQEHAKGTIEVGKLADLVVLEEDLIEVPDDQLHAVTPRLTVLGGNVVHGS